MNLFLPEETIVDSVEALDDKRLIKQILECKTILDVALEGKQGYAKHPVVAYYSKYPWYVCSYGSIACVEYYNRFGKEHKLWRWFAECRVLVRKLYNIPEPFYCEGAKTDPNCIRTTENTVELFRNKLGEKWDNDKITPKWTNRQPPEWYKSKR